MSGEVVIAERFRGPPDSGNGGYSCGRVAAAIDGPAEVTLRVPPPLERPLDLRHGETVELWDRDTLVATGRPAEVDIDVPEPVGVEEAREAAEHYGWMEGHPYPTCFVCGPERAAGDGLRIFPTAIDDRDLYVSPWTPDPSLLDADGMVRPEFAWAALDCPSGLATNAWDDIGMILLGRLTADLREPVPGGTTYVTTAWPVARDGRKLHTGSALFSDAGRLLAVARAVWIELAA